MSGRRADGLPLSLHRGGGARRRCSGGRPGRRRPGPRSRRAASCAAAPSNAAPTRWRPPGPPWRSASPGAGGCSASATAAARPTPRGRRSCSATRRTVARCPPCRWSRTRPSSPHCPTTWASSWSSRASSSPTPARRHRRRLLHQRRLGRHAARLRGGGTPRPPHRRPLRLRGIRHGHERRRPALPGRALRERPPDSGGPGRADAGPVGGRAAPPPRTRGHRHSGRSS